MGPLYIELSLQENKKISTFVYVFLIFYLKTYVARYFSTRFSVCWKLCIKESESTKLFLLIFSPRKKYMTWPTTHKPLRFDRIYNMCSILKRFVKSITHCTTSKVTISQTLTELPIVHFLQLQLFNFYFI